ncbi:PLP-dependent aminotransferase family protein [Formosa sp. A9]|uniref:MocR-like pyridoxine biosynthesis transcription factor PdxR n=1 Tax=Formosa sp. A9 TaxID=3442641 RepID=UPI003EB94C3D
MSQTLFTAITLTHSTERPVYLQLADEMLDLIRSGKLKSGQKLPSSRKIAETLNINRVTVTKALEELQLQGWIESYVGKGTFVSFHIPELSPTKLETQNNKQPLKQSGFEIRSNNYLNNPYFISSVPLHLDDGYPDPKLAPLKELYRAYRSQLIRESSLYSKFGAYSQPDGSMYYREALSKYLNNTRGLKTTPDNILSVRGTLMGLNLVCNALIQPGDVIVSGVPGWQRAEHNFLHSKAKHIGISVDEFGIVVDELRAICNKTKVRMVYVTPHHHYPTTVSLRIDRRLELLNLANEFGFIIFEDDYDFTFHYNNSPLLPLASADENGMVIYCGSFSKSFSPAFRMGYIVASENVIKHLANIRMLLDRQGDHILDNAMAELLNEGTISRYLRRTLSIYKKRRDFFCELLESELKPHIKFKIPDGGMTVWTEFDKSVNLPELSKKAYQEGLYISDGILHNSSTYNKNAIRLGFASSTESELSQSVEIMQNLIG